MRKSAVLLIAAIGLSGCANSGVPLLDFWYPRNFIDTVSQNMVIDVRVRGILYEWGLPGGSVTVKELGVIHIIAFVSPVDRVRYREPLLQKLREEGYTHFRVE